MRENDIYVTSDWDTTLYMRLNHIIYESSVDLFNKINTTLDGNRGRDRLPRHHQYRLHNMLRHQ